MFRYCTMKWNIAAEDYLTRQILSESGKSPTIAVDLIRFLDAESASPVGSPSILMLTQDDKE